MNTKALEKLIEKWEKEIKNNRAKLMTQNTRLNTWRMLTYQNNTLRNCIRDLRACVASPVADDESGLHLTDVMVSGCPKCNSSNITRRQVNGIFVCNMCGYEWATEP